MFSLLLVKQIVGGIDNGNNYAEILFKCELFMLVWVYFVIRYIRFMFIQAYEPLSVYY